MTPQDNWQPEMARLAQRQDQLERQQRDTTRSVEVLRRDVDGRIDSLRRDIDWQLRNRKWRVRSLERSRNTVEFLIALCIPFVATIVMIIAVTGSREQRQESGEPEERSLSSMNAPPAARGDKVQPGLPPAGHISTDPVARHASAIDSQ